MREGWKIKKLGEVCSFQRGLTYTKSDEVEFSENCVLRSNNIDLDTMSIVLDDLKYVRKDLIIGEDKIIKPNTILICMSNGSKQHLGKVAFIDRDYGYAFGGFMGLIIPQSTVFPKYIYYGCLSSSYKHFLAGIGNGINITNLKFSDLSNYDIPIPPLSEQKRIVAELDLLSEVIAKKRGQLTQLDTLAQSLFYTMFGDPITDEKGWEKVKLSSVIQVKGRVGWKGYKKEDLRESGILAIGGGHITDTGEIDLSNPVYLSEEKYYESPEIMIETGDLVLVQRGTIGKIGLIKNDIGKATINPCVLILRPRLFLVNGDYILYLFLSSAIQDGLKSFVRGVAQPMITQQQVNSMVIPLPPLALQQQFAEKIEAIEKQKELIKQSLSEVQLLFDSRMDYYFNEWAE